MTPEEIKDRIKDIITNHIRSAEDPAASEILQKDIHDVLTAKMRDKVLGPTPPAEVTPEPNEPVAPEPEPTPE